MCLICSLTIKFLTWNSIFFIKKFFFINLVLFDIFFISHSFSLNVSKTFYILYFILLTSQSLLVWFSCLLFLMTLMGVFFPCLLCFHCKLRFLEILSEGIPWGLGLKYNPQERNAFASARCLKALSTWDHFKLNCQLEDFPVHTGNMNSPPKQYWEPAVLTYYHIFVPTFYLPLHPRPKLSRWVGGLVPSLNDRVICSV